MTMGLDGFTGAILAVESVVDAAAILHGPLGCKYFQSSMSDTHYTRSGSQDASELGELGFFMQARVPCDFLMCMITSTEFGQTRNSPPYYR